MHGIFYKVQLESVKKKEPYSIYHLTNVLTISLHFFTGENEEENSLLSKLETRTMLRTSSRRMVQSKTCRRDRYMARKAMSIEKLRPKNGVKP